MISGASRALLWFAATISGPLGGNGRSSPSTVTQMSTWESALVSAWAPIMKALKQAPAKELMTFEGGSPAISSPCEAKAPHGYLGLEPRVVSAIAAWIRAH